MVYGTYNYSIHGLYKPSNITGGPHLVYIYIYITIVYDIYTILYIYIWMRLYTKLYIYCYYSTVQWV